jgi:hypothetical protein
LADGEDFVWCDQPVDAGFCDNEPSNAPLWSSPRVARCLTSAYRDADSNSRRMRLNLVEFIQAELTRLHGALERGVADLTPEQWHAIPAGNPRANHIAFEMWHYVRTEDNIVRFILQDRRPTAWMDGGWAEKLGLPPVAQGTGMPAADAQAMRIDDLDGFREYRRQVWASTSEWLANPDASEFEKIVQVKPLGEMPKIRALGQVCMTHGFTHLGEIELIRTLHGLPPAIGI